MDIEFLELTEQGLKKVRDIYNFYILNTTSTFHTHTISVEDMKEYIYTDHPKYKSFLISVDEVICGYCYISHYKKRQAYDRTAEVTIYLKPEFKAKGIGKVALQHLEVLAKEKGFSVLLATITLENETSVALFEKAGYEKCAHFKEVGEKFGKILDVVVYQKII